ncbi:sensor histidine kinase [Luteimicrobium subarcticum]|uniref:histidine kinase n=1 Tax=Luteimicrobium subarcticum TaxID=620910 RepID=A0A2M8W6J1_9MICO|nr:histidine kinase [Luteimicrobium subarcticum]PJI86550.1 signal transduction histidine kinase [Luteimicrobium subarcticum]
MDGLLPWWRSRSVLFRDACLAVVLAAVALAAVPHDGWPAWLTVLGALSLVARRTRPEVVLAVTGGLLGIAVVGTVGVVLTLPALVAVLTVVRRSSPWLGLAAAGVEAAWVCAATVLHDAPGAGTLALLVAALFALAVAAALAVRVRDDAVRVTRDAVAWSDVARDATAARADAEERLRAARALHDAAREHAAVVTVQADVAEQLVTAHPEHARAALDQVQTAGRAVVQELAALSLLLPQDPESAEGTPGPVHLRALLDEARAAGLTVTTTSTGEPYPLSPEADLAATHVVQEALANAHRHGGGSAHVRLAYTPGSLVVEVTNPLADDTTAADAAARRDHTDEGGLAGLRARVDALGGTFDAGPGDGSTRGRFVVRAALPTPDARDDAADDAAHDAPEHIALQPPG